MHFETTQLAHTFISVMLQALSLDRFFFSEWENVKHRDDYGRRIVRSSILSHKAGFGKDPGNLPFIYYS